MFALPSHEVNDRIGQPAIVRANGGNYDVHGHPR